MRASEILKIASLYKKAISTLGDQKWLFNYNFEEIAKKLEILNRKNNNKYMAFDLICSTYDYIFKRFDFLPAKDVLSKIKNNNIGNGFTTLYIHDLIHYTLRNESRDDIVNYIDNTDRDNMNLYFEEDLVDYVQDPYLPYNRLEDGVSAFFIRLFEKTFKRLDKKVVPIELYLVELKKEYEKNRSSLYNKEYDKAFRMILERIEKAFNPKLYPGNNLIDHNIIAKLFSIVDNTLKFDYQLDLRSGDKRLINDDIHGALRLWLKLLDKKVTALLDDK